MDPYRILVVDDEEEMRKIVSATLGDTYEIVQAFDGLDALDKVDRYEPDFVILDVKMPLMNGIETCEAIRNNPIFKDTPVMFLSALDTREDIMKAYGAGANLYLTKPIDPERLHKNVDLFFKMNRPSLRPKQLSMKEILEMEQAAEKRSPVSVHDSDTQDEAYSTPVEDHASPTPPLEEERIHISRDYRIYEKPRVMVVDDDINVITMMTIALRDNFEVVKAMDGLQAVEKIIRYQPDIALVDIMMPKMSGYQLCESIRRNATFRDMPIIVVSAKSSRRDQEYAFRCGASSFLAKPFEPGRLVKLLESLVKSEGFTIRKKRVSFEEISEEEKEEREKQKHRSDEYLRRLKRTDPSR
jgi:DNA-binding response OmpR family regulator